MIRLGAGRLAAWCWWVVLACGVSGQARQAHASSTAAAGVVAVEVEGLRRVGREAALAAIGTKVGGAFDADQVTRDIHSLWKTGFFRDVRVWRETLPEGVRLIYVVTEKPAIHAVRFVGQDDVGEDDIKGVVDVKPATILNHELIQKNIAKIKDLYIDKGFFLAEVAYRVEPADKAGREVDVVFDIVENAKVRVKQITLLGNKALSDEQIKGAMQTREGHELSWLTQAGTYKEEYFQTDLLRIQALYYDQGFVTVKVSEPSAMISKDRRDVYLSCAIEEGERYKIGKVTFSGAVQLTSKEGRVVADAAILARKLTIHTGEYFNRTKLFSDIQSITDVFRDHGYAFANVTPNSRIHAETREIDLDLEVERGDVAYFGRIEITGNTRTRDKVIRRELRIFEGERYNGSDLNLSRARVYQLGFFETVNITTQAGAKSDVLDVTVEVKEKSTGTFQVGVGLSSIERFIATAQISQNNFLGHGQLLALSAQVSFGDFARQLATLQFYEPYFLDSMWSFGVNTYITQRLYRDFQRNATGISPSLGYPITHALRVNVGYTLEKIKILTGFDQSTVGSALAHLNRNGKQSSVNGSISYDTRDNRLFPSRGHYHVLSSEISSPLLGADAGLSFQRFELDLRYYYQLPLSLVAKLNASVGRVFGGGREGVAIGERYFPGGIYSVRGFEPRALGPTRRVTRLEDPLSGTTEFIVGGNKQAIFNVELEFPLIQAAGIKGVLFADAGNAYDDDEGLFYLGVPKERRPKAYLRSGRVIDPPLGLYYSVGFGFRWFSPIGPLRFEWGLPLVKRRSTDRDLIFEFTIGNFF